MAFGIYWNNNIYWYDKYEKALRKSKKEDIDLIYIFFLNY